jgi:hypothetical protein
MLLNNFERIMKLTDKQIARLGKMRCDVRERHSATAIEGNCARTFTEPYGDAIQLAVSFAIDLVIGKESW